jgi:hypothetical protein
MKGYLKLGFLLFGVLFFAPTSFAQFYNGLQMTFGKSRVQYNDFYWQYYRFDKFDVYFNQFGQNLALYTQWFAGQELTRVQNTMDYNLERRILFLVYNKLTDFRQSNIGLVNGNEDYNTGGVTHIVNNKVFLYFEGDHKKFQHQITSSISEVIVNEMLYGSDLKDNVANSTLINLPDWFTKGLLSYLSENWSVEIEDRVKDGVLSGKFKKINRLMGDDATYAGHSFWRYVEKTYGRSVIPNIIYITRVNKSAKYGFLYVLGSSLKEVSKEWWAYYQDKYKKFDTVPESIGTPLLKRTKKTMVYQHVKISPNGQYFAYVTNELGQYRLWLYNEQTGRRKCLLKREHKLDQIPDYSFPVLAWHPNGKILTFINEEKGGLKLSHYNIETQELTRRNFLYMEKVSDFSYSNDGAKLVMSALRDGKIDIYVHTLASATNEQITDDLADDQTPRFIGNSKKIIFSSNRLSDTLVLGSMDAKALSFEYKLFVCPYPRNTTKLTRISNDEVGNHTQPFEIGANRFSYLSDANGIINRYIADYDSGISMVDTVIHYRYFTKAYPVTNFPRNILEQDIEKKSNKLGQIFFWNNRNKLFKNDLNVSPLGENLMNTEYRNETIKNTRRADSLANITKKNLFLKQNQAPQKFLPFPKDTGKIKKEPDVIDINHYVFEIEKPGGDLKKMPQSDITTKKDDDTINNQPKIRIYQTAFYTNLLVNQVDFSFLSSTYQIFNGGAVYYNPGFNMLIKIGTTDLFEDYKITGGFRLSVDFQSNEYLLSFENLKKRWDKQLVLHRQAYKNTISVSEGGVSNYYLIKTVTTDGYYILKYPFSQVLALRGTASLRHDRVAYLSTDMNALAKPNEYNLWGGLKLELIFDNTRSLGINVFSGTRYKIFGEAYKQLNLRKSDLFVLGADYRHYQVIDRNLILATRFAGSSSFGNSRLIYYLGSVDGWINLSTKVPTFDNSIRIDPNGHYAYQALATNMRGFVQNARNGNNFAVINNEVRWPFIKYFANYPISSNFWNSLQVVGFFDVGSAWTGWTPYSGHNAYEYDEVKSGNITVTLDSNRSPVIYGYGFGFRAQLLGYFMRFDLAWGVENKVVLPKVFYLSLNLDF